MPLLSEKMLEYGEVALETEVPLGDGFVANGFNAENGETLVKGLKSALLMPMFSFMGASNASGKVSVSDPVQLPPTTESDMERCLPTSTLNGIISGLGFGGEKFSTLAKPLRALGSDNHDGKPDA